MEKRSVTSSLSSEFAVLMGRANYSVLLLARLSVANNAEKMWRKEIRVRFILERRTLSNFSV